MDPETSQALATRILRILQSIIGTSDESLPRLAAIELDSVPFPDNYDESDESPSEYDLGSTGLWHAFTRVEPSFPLNFEGLSSTDAKFQRCLNVHAFTVLLTESRLIPLPRQAMLAIGQATEGVIVQKEDGSPEFVSSDPHDIEQLDMKVAVAAIWIQRTSHVFWRSNPRDTISEGGPFWKRIYANLSKEDPNHLSLYRERLSVWVQQFGEISENSNVAEETHDIAREVQDTLDEIYSVHMELY
ncbi:hypothetical protein RU639_003960 [Aspergillus parasiticus]